MSRAKVPEWFDHRRKGGIPCFWIRGKLLNVVLALMVQGSVEKKSRFRRMLIDRSQVLAKSFEYMSRAKAKSLQGGKFMAFKNEKATGLGVLREWFVLVRWKLFNSTNALFVTCPNDHMRFLPNAESKQWDPGKIQWHMTSDVKEVAGKS
jgi:hypothetical protein